MLPIIVGGFMYGKMEAVIYDNAYQANLVVINQFRQSIDNRVKEVQQFATQISINPKILSILDEARLDNPQNDFYPFCLRPNFANICRSVRL